MENDKKPLKFNHIKILWIRKIACKAYEMVNAVQTSSKGENRSTGLYGRLNGICSKMDFWKNKNHRTLSIITA